MRSETKKRRRRKKRENSPTVEIVVFLDRSLSQLRELLQEESSSAGRV